MSERHYNTVTALLKIGDFMRYQDPPLQRTEGKKARWYIRPYIDEIGPDGKNRAVRPRIYFGLCKEVNKAEALKRKNFELERINRRTYILASQLKFGEFLDRYLDNHVRVPEMLSLGSVMTYESHIKAHIRPWFGEMAIGSITTETIDQFLNAKTKDGLSWNYRVNLKALMHTIFKQAQKWGLYREMNPADNANAGRKQRAREPRKLTVEETRALLAELRPDVRELCEVALYCGLRISEILGLQWKHLEFKSGLVLIRQKLYNGVIGECKTELSRREVPMAAELAKNLHARQMGADDWVFNIKTRQGICRRPSNLSQSFLKPAAEKLKLYKKGFGFHQFRREAITQYAEAMGAHQAQRLAGHSNSAMTFHYTMADLLRQQAAVNDFENIVTGRKQ